MPSSWLWPPSRTCLRRWFAGRRGRAVVDVRQGGCACVARALPQMWFEPRVHLAPIVDPNGGRKYCGSARRKRMPMTTTDLRDAALSLSLDERARLAREVLQSLDGDADADADAAWARTVERRVEEVRDGSVELIDGDEVHSTIRARLAARDR